MEVKRRERNNVIIFDIIGDFLKSTPNIGSLHQCMKEELNSGKRNFLLNLENTDNIDSFGIGEMLAIFLTIDNLGGELKLTPIKFFIEHDCRPGTGFVERVCKDEEEAIKSFSE